MQYDYDIIIVGAGLVGNCLALALKDSGLKLALIEANTLEQRQQSPAGDRALALSAGTVTLLQALGAWEGIKSSATPITDIHISDQGHFGKTRLSAKKYAMDALGYVITAREIETHVTHLVNQTDVVQLCPARLTGLISDQSAVHISLKDLEQAESLTSRLLVGADGGQSSVRHLLEIPQTIREYEQTAIVTTVKLSHPHRQTAFERFTSSGPLAMLPLSSNQAAVVWTRSHQQAEVLLTLPEDDFIQQLQNCFGYPLGQLSLAAPRRAFPLSLIRAETMIKGRAVILGNAAHQLHPVAGQGFNLGIRDVAQLAEMITNQLSQNEEIGQPEQLFRYAQNRQKDHDKTIGFTHSLVKLFSTDRLPIAATRSMGLTILDHLPIAKSMLAKHAMGLAERLPRVGQRR